MQNKLGTPTHPLKKGDVATIKNTDLDGKEVTEGRATIVGATSRDDRYKVRFSDGRVVERYVSNLAS